MSESDFAPAPGGALPSRSDEALARLADMVAARLAGLKAGARPSQGRDHGFESRMRYQLAHVSTAFGRACCFVTLNGGNML